MITNELPILYDLSASGLRQSCTIWNVGVISMDTSMNSDNIFSIGTIVSAKVEPGLSLVIAKYYQRIYYCSIVGQPTHKQFAYFERELIPPTK